MMARIGGTAVALAAAAVVLPAVAWLDTTVVAGVYRDAAATFGPEQAGLVGGLGMVLVAGAAVLLAALAWRSASPAVGLVYAGVGAYLTFQPWVVWTFAAQINDTPPVLPDPLLTAVTQVYHATDGPLSAAGIVGAAMLVAGVAVVVRSLRGAGAPAPR